MVNITITQVSANTRKNIIQIAYQKVSSSKQQQDTTVRDNSDPLVEKKFTWNGMLINRAREMKDENAWLQLLFISDLVSTMTANYNP